MASLGREKQHKGLFEELTADGGLSQNGTEHWIRGLAALGYTVLHVLGLRAAALRHGAFACNMVALGQLAGLFLVARLVAYPNKCIIVYSDYTHVLLY